MKKIKSIFIFASVLCLTLSACGKKASGTAAPSAAGTAVSGSTAETADDSSEEKASYVIDNSKDDFVVGDDIPSGRYVVNLTGEGTFAMKDGTDLAYFYFGSDSFKTDNTIKMKDKTLITMRTGYHIMPGLMGAGTVTFTQYD